MSAEETNIIEDGLKAIAKMTKEEFEGLKLILKLILKEVTVRELPRKFF